MTYSIYQAKKRSFIHLYSLYLSTFFDRHEEWCHVAWIIALNSCYDMHTYTQMRILCICTCMRAFVREWVNAYAGCGPPARLHYVYVVYDVRRPPQVCSWISPAVIAAKCVGVVSHMELSTGSDFSAGMILLSADACILLEF